MSLKPKTIYWVSIINLLFFIIDRALKYLAATTIDESREVIKSIFWFGYYPNDGIGFGIPVPSLPTFIILIVVLAGIAYWMFLGWRSQQINIIWGTTLIFVGALSNLIDRMIYGHVVDYLNLFDWSIFNIADLMIFIGVGAVLFSWWHKKKALQKN